jgi:guanylate kinase
VGRLVILSGPSCAGKGPLYAALKKFYPEIAGRLDKFVLYDSRAPRPGEVDGVDFHFRSRQFIEGLRDQPHFRVFEVRNDLQAMDTRELESRCVSGATRDVFFEGNPFIGSGLLDLAETQRFACLSVFLSPLTREEIVELKSRTPSVDLPDFLTDVMRRKLLRRTTRQKGNLSLKDLENIEIRAASAYGEMRQAWRFDHVIPCHDGEDSEHWDAFYYPIGEARKALHAFAALLEGRKPAWAERWDQELIA